MSCAQAAEPFDVPLGKLSGMDPGNNALDGVRSPMQMGNFEGEKAQLIVEYRDSLMSAVHKLAEPIEMSFGMWTRVDNGSIIMLDGTAHCRYLANTIEPSMCGGDAVLCQLTLTMLYYSTQPCVGTQLVAVVQLFAGAIPTCVLYCHVLHFQRP